MAPRPRRTVRGKALRLACWNADVVRGRKLELEHFFSKHGVDICLLGEKFLNSGQAFRLANYVCHSTDRPTAEDGTAILVRCGFTHHSVPLPGLTQVEATATHIMLAGRPVNVLGAYFSPSRPLIGADLDASIFTQNASLGSNSRQPNNQSRNFSPISTVPHKH